MADTTEQKPTCDARRERDTPHPTRSVGFELCGCGCPTIGVVMREDGHPLKTLWLPMTDALLMHLRLGELLEMMFWSVEDSARRAQHGE